MKVLAKGPTLTIKLDGFEKVWALKSKLEIPRTVITEVEWCKKYLHPKRLIRSSGAGLPKMLSAGTFRGRGEWVFLYLKGARGFKRRTDDVLVIRLHDFVYSEVAISLDEKRAQQVVTWWRSTSHPK